MAYSYSPVTVERMRPFLQPLADGQEAVWRTAPGRSRWLAYRIREALATVADNPDNWPALAPWTDAFRIEVMSSREVRATRKASAPIEIIANPKELKAPARLEAAPMYSAEEVIRRWQAKPAEEPKLYYPSANLPRAELVSLWEWANGAGVMFFENVGALTLIERDEELADYAWSPEDFS